MEQVYPERKRDLNSNVNACSSDNNLSEFSAAKVAYATLPYRGKVDRKILKFLKRSLVNVPILYPLKTPENFWFSGVFRGYKMETLARNGFKKLLPKEVETRIIYTGVKLRSQFAIKDLTKFEHQHDLVYHVKCTDCDDKYTREV